MPALSTVGAKPANLDAVTAPQKTLVVRGGATGVTISTSEQTVATWAVTVTAAGVATITGYMRTRVATVGDVVQYRAYVDGNVLPGTVYWKPGAADEVTLVGAWPTSLAVGGHTLTITVQQTAGTGTSNAILGSSSWWTGRFDPGAATS